MTAAEPRAEVTIADGVARLRLCRPPHNEIDRGMTEQLDRAVGACAARSDLRAVLVSAEGRDFSVGGDLASLGAAGDDVGPLLDSIIGTYHTSLATITELEVPVACAIQGAVAGGALGLLWAADLVLAADNTRLLLAFAKLGLSGDGGSSWYLPRLIGLRRALDLVMSERVIDATEAVDLGLVTSVVPLGRLEEESEAAVRRLADGPTAALGAIRRLYRQGLASDLSEALRREKEAIVRMADSADAREGIAAFQEKRQPHFEGR